MVQFDSLALLEDSEFLGVARNYARASTYSRKTQIVRDGCSEGSCDFGKYHFYRKGLFVTYDPRSLTFPTASLSISVRGETYRDNEYYHCDVMPYIASSLRPGYTEDDLFTICALIDELAELFLSAMDEVKVND